MICQEQEPEAPPEEDAPPPPLEPEPTQESGTEDYPPQQGDNW